MTKQLKDLNLLDRFLFAEAMEDADNMKDILDIILGQDTVLKCLPQTEKESRTSPMNRFVKLDVCAWDEDDTVYDTEVQKENTHNLPRRSRLYQGIIDSKLLPPGTADFNNLNDVFIILITPFDLFGYDLYRYTFRMECEEVPGLKLADGATRIFLNTRGKNPENVSPELIELLHYMETSTDEVSQNCKSDRIHEMHRRVNRIKSSEEIGVKFMQAWEEKILDKRKAHEEGYNLGRSAGREQLLQEQIKKKLEKGYTPEEIAAFLEEDIGEVKRLIKQIQSDDQMK